MGHQVNATDGPGALKAIGDGEWDVLLVDVLMPDVDGLEVIHAARQHRTRTAPRIVAMSGGGRISAHDCLEMAATLGADACVRKPIAPSALARLLQPA